MIKKDKTDTVGYIHLFLITKNIHLFHINEILHFTSKELTPNHMFFMSAFPMIDKIIMRFFHTNKYNLFL